MKGQVWASCGRSPMTAMKPRKSRIYGPREKRSKVGVGLEPDFRCAALAGSSRPIAVLESLDFIAHKPTSTRRGIRRRNVCLRGTRFSRWSSVMSQKPMLGNRIPKQPPVSGMLNFLVPGSCGVRAIWQVRPKGVHTSLSSSIKRQSPTVRTGICKPCSAMTNPLRATVTP